MSKRVCTYVVGFVAVIVFTSCTSESEQTTKEVVDVDPAEWPTHEVWNVETEFRDSGMLRARLEAKTARIFESQARTYLSGGFVLLIPDDLDTTRLTADSAVIFDDSKDMQAFGNVVVKGSEKTIRTDEIHWSNQDRLFTSDTPVEIVTPTQRIVGVGFKATERLTEYSVYKVTGTHILERKR